MADKRPELFDLSENIAWMFPTPIIGHQWSDTENLNKELETLILQKKADDNTLLKSNAGGWQSTDDLLSWDASCVETLKGMMNKLLLSVVNEMTDPEHRKGGRRFRLDCWANVNGPGHYNVIHSHPNALWSCVYYVNQGEPDPTIAYGGKLELIDPRNASSFIQIEGDNQQKRCIIENTSGFMAMFPSWMKHMVHPHYGKGERISIAMNALPVPKS
jgi:uncharacterized protein (TIGR02466 family)